MATPDNEELPLYPAGDPRRASPTGSPGGRLGAIVVTPLAWFILLARKLAPHWRQVLAAGALLLVLLLLGFVPRWTRARELKAQARIAAGKLPVVTYAQVESAPTEVDLTLPGNVEAAQQTQINARTSGYVRRFFADIGDRVRANQILAEIDIPEVDQEAQQAAADLAHSQAGLAQADAQLAQQSAALATSRANAAKANADLQRSRQTAEQSQAQLREARANAALARVTWVRWQSLVEGGAISAQEADEKHAAYNTSAAQVTSLEAALRASNADVESFRSALGAARANIEASSQNVRAYQAATVAARASVAASLTNVQRFKVLLGFREVRAPYEGVVTARNVEAGSLISPGGGGAQDPAASGSAGASSSSGSDGSGSTSSAASGGGVGSSGGAAGGLFTVARLDRMRIFIDVPQTEAPVVHPGLVADITVKELPQRHFTGQVLRTSNSLDQTARTMNVLVELPNSDGALLPGMYSQVRLHTRQLSPPLLVPAGALITDARGTRVAALDGNDRISFRDVQVARDFGESLEISAGLSKGMRVVTNPNDELKVGTRVQAEKAPASAQQQPGGGTMNGADSQGGLSGPGPHDQSPNASAKMQAKMQGGEAQAARGRTHP